ncbi:hypothetical protein [Maridesulfovibrio ferrireducens]|uniref:hypothetical protein n=1 Tax=Maridesulfovibrio ferrireducens TaxID=246191 RepID=UPI001A2A3A97|nr:hypothetical protein [Maridesulfovibrio ferrireducens]MBI9109882.1 hypothetical protein [Maridesulfovibrio ferrireducens]
MEVEDPIDELFQLVEAIDLCSKTAPSGLSYMLKILKNRLYQVVLKLEEEEVVKE